MLGRLRMPVSDCIAQYKRLGGSVFGKPRWFNAINFGIFGVRRHKYDTAKFEAVIRSLIEERLGGLPRKPFKFDQDLCRT